MKVIEGSLLDTKVKYIVQQCNCLTVRAHGLSQVIVDKYPWADPYGCRKSMGKRNCAIENDRDKPGSIKIFDSPDEDKHVICMFAQWTPGIPGKFTTYPDYDCDTYINRQLWFNNCLNEIGKLDIKEVAFPWKIGCGLAGGNWTTYKSMIERFERTSGIEVYIYRL